MAPETALFADAVRRVQDGSDELKETEALLDALSEEEKQSMLHGNVDFWRGIAAIMADGYNAKAFRMAEVRRLGIPGVHFTDGPRGVVMGKSTAFPVSVARGATWDPALEERVGYAMGIESRAQGANYFAGVCINLPRHPAWGRYQETYGEDPVLLGDMAVAFVRGLQRNVMACAKHYALNSMENMRFEVNVTVDDASLHEVYLPHFEQCVKAGIASIMSAYNAVNGEWVGHSTILLNTILRKQWGFQGFVISDFIFGHRDGAISLMAGMDIEAPFAQLRPIAVPRALADGTLTPEHVQTAARNIVLTQLRHYAARDEKVPNLESVFSNGHRRLAREVAERSIVLLKNETSRRKPILPLKPVGEAKYAIIGRLADSQNTGDCGSSDVHSPHVVTAYQGLKQALPADVDLVLSGTDDVTDAVKAAENADTALVIVGLAATDEGEYMIPDHRETLKTISPPFHRVQALWFVWALLRKMFNRFTRWVFGRPERRQPAVGKGGDRSSLHLRERDVEIIRAVSKVNPRTVVAIVGSGAIVMEEWKTLPAAILMAWYGGCEGGTALANVLLGNVDASGRLPYSVPESEEHLPFFDKSAKQITYDRWFGQRLLDKLQVSAAFPLGFGLSYTTFELSNARILEDESSGQTDFIVLRVQVSNTGSRDGHCVVQVYGSPSPAADDFPRSVLLGFTSVRVGRDEPVTVDVKSALRPLKRWEGGRFVPAAPKYVLAVGQHANDAVSLRLTANFEDMEGKRKI